jgi:hypothetical protein
MDNWNVGVCLEKQFTRVFNMQFTSCFRLDKPQESVNHQSSKGGTIKQTGTFLHMMLKWFHFIAVETVVSFLKYLYFIVCYCLEYYIEMYI